MTYKHGKAWTPHEIETLRTLWKADACHFEIARQLGRSYHSIRAAALKAGLYVPEKKAAIRERAVRRMLQTKAAMEAPAQITLAGPKWSWPEPKRVSL